MYSFGQEARLGIPVGNTSAVEKAVFSPDGKHLLVVTEDKTARIWDIRSGKLLMILTGHSERINTAVYSPDGKYIVTASIDKTARIWESCSGKLLSVLIGHKSWLGSASFSPDGKNIITISGDNTAMIWGCPGGKLISVLEGHSEQVNHAAFSPDGKLIVTISDDYTARIWERMGSRLSFTVKGFTEAPHTFSFSPDGKFVAFATYGNEVQILDIGNKILSMVLKGHLGTVFSVNYSPDGKQLVTSSLDSTAGVWDSKSGRLIHLLKGHDGLVFSAVFSPDGKYILTSSRDGRAILWDSKSGKKNTIFDDNLATGFAAGFSADGRLVVTASSVRKVRISECPGGQTVINLEGNTFGFNSTFFTPDGKLLYTGSFDNNTWVWDFKSGKLLRQYDCNTGDAEGFSSCIKSNFICTRLPGNKIYFRDIISGRQVLLQELNSNVINSGKFSPDGESIVIANDSLATVFEWGSGRKKSELRGHKSIVNDAVYSPDGNYLLTLSDDSSAGIWNSRSGKLLYFLKLPDQRLFFAKISPGGKYIAASSESNHSLCVWETESGKLIRILKGHNAFITGFSFSPDGKYMVSSSEDHTAIIWELESGKQVHVLDSHSDWVESAVFSPDGKYVVTASYDGSFIVQYAFSGQVLTRTFVFKNNDYVHLHASGLFDATAGAMNEMYWVKGTEIIEFKCLKERYWYPGLWDSVMQNRELRNVRGMNEIRLQPEVEVRMVKEDTLPIILRKREGGYGKVSVSVNGKEVSEDLRGRDFDTSLAVQNLYFSLENNPVIKPGEVNKISVRAWSRDSFMSGSDQEIIYFAPGTKNADYRPSFYAVICGINEYKNSSINLKYPVRDALSVSDAIRSGAEKLFGRERTFIFTLTSPGEIKPTRENLRRTFDSIAELAHAGDVLFIFLSGHGISLDGENGDFYFLTSDVFTASQDGLRDEMIRRNTTVSSSELTGWIKAIPALKQVMIIDACGSGKAVENLMLKRNVSQYQIKAIDRMKDRTGMFILSGCAVDAQSYESSVYGHGFLAYALLESFSGIALRDGRYIDVSTLFNYCRDRVPELAGEIGGIQDPQMFIPASGSFDIGLLDQDDRMNIPLDIPKMVFVRSNLVERNENEDVLNLSQQLDEQLRTAGINKNRAVFIDAWNFPGACKISGTYAWKKAGIEAGITIRCGDKVVKKKFFAKNTEELVGQIITETGITITE